MRDTLILGGLIAVALIAGALVFFYSGGTLGTLSSAAIESRSAAAVPFAELARGWQSSVLTRVNYLITSPEQFDELWKMIDTENEKPSVDFSRSSVAAIFAGQRPTAGYDIMVSRITDAQDRLVTVRVSAPDSSCALAQSLTAPYQIIELPLTALPLAHEDEFATTSCMR